MLKVNEVHPLLYSYSTISSLKSVVVNGHESKYTYVIIRVLFGVKYIRNELFLAK